MAQDGNPRRISLVFPIILITIGVLFLVRNWRPDFEPWPILRNYWPLILIFIGVGKIWDSTYRSRNPNAPPGISAGATVGTLAFVLVLVILFWHGRSFSHGHRFSGSKHSTRIVEPQRAKSHTSDWKWARDSSPSTAARMTSLTRTSLIATLSKNHASITAWTAASAN
jgi:hypothetical protein